MTIILMILIWLKESDRELMVKYGKRLCKGIAASFYCSSVDKLRLTGPGLTSVTSPCNARSPKRRGRIAMGAEEGDCICLEIPRSNINLLIYQRSGEFRKW